MKRLSKIEVDGVLYAIKDTDAVEVPSTAEVGQFVHVTEVDGTGKPTSWEPVNPPSGIEDVVLVDVVLEEEISKFNTPSFSNILLEEYDEIHLSMEITPSSDETQTQWGGIEARLWNGGGGVCINLMYVPKIIPPYGSEKSISLTSCIRDKSTESGWWKRLMERGTNVFPPTYDTNWATKGIYFSFNAWERKLGVGTKIKLVLRKYKT